MATITTKRAIHWRCRHTPGAGRRRTRPCASWAAPSAISARSPSSSSRHTLADPCDHEPRDYERPADTSITLETMFLARQMDIRTAFRTAIGMSFISMIAMETVMNAVDRGLTGGAKLTWRVVPIMLAAGFVAPLPYNYWRLKVLGRACH